uniref:Uncharacterized protein n=1 Tax=Pan troglodytes TaxID=9598 RepID=A0A2I3RDU0_PANTR
MMGNNLFPSTGIVSVDPTLSFPLVGQRAGGDGGTNSLEPAMPNTSHSGEVSCFLLPLTSSSDLLGSLLRCWQPNQLVWPWTCLQGLVMLHDLCCGH